MDYYIARGLTRHEDIRIHEHRPMSFPGKQNQQLSGEGAQPSSHKPIKN